MRVVIINPEEKTVIEKELETASLKEIYKTLGCTCICCPVVLNNEDSLYCDDEFWLNCNDYIAPGFTLEEDQPWSYAIAGKAMLIGCDQEGNNKSAQSTVEYINSIIQFKPSTNPL